MPRMISYVSQFPFGTDKYLKATEHEHQVCLFELIRGLKMECISPSPRGGKFDDVPYDTLKKIIDACDLIYAIPNGGARDSNKNIAMQIGMQLKLEGVKKGVPDISCDFPNAGFAGLKIELKKYGGKLSEEQITFMENARRNYWACVCAVGYMAAFKSFLYYLGINNLFPQYNFDNINLHHDLKKYLVEK